MVTEAIGNFLVSLFPNIEVLKANVDLSAPPKAENFIVINVINRRRLGTNQVTYIDIESDPEKGIEEKHVRRLMTSMEVSFQLDFYGKGSADMAQVFVTLFYDSSGYNAFPEQVKPLDVTDPVRMVFTAFENSYTERWKVEAKVQINPVIELPQEFFDTETLTINTITV